MSNSNPLVSVIVPVYNVERYIFRCIDSVLDQTYRNFELILVNDGSKDNSKEIIERAKLKDDRIIVINKKNGGVSSARTAGLKKSKGEFVLFIDGDDYVDKDYIRYFYDLINCDKDLDVAVDYNKYSIHTPNQVKAETIEILKPEKVMEFIYTSKIHEAVWNKMYRRSFLEKNKLHFNKDIWYGEGMLFNIQCLQCVDKVAVGNRRVYHQVHNASSAMRNFKMDSNLCGLRSLDLQKACWKTENVDVLKAWEFHRWCYNMAILKGIIKTSSKKKYENEYKEAKKNMKKGWYYPWTVSISRSRKMFYIFSTFFPVLGAKIFLANEKRKAEKASKNEELRTKVDKPKILIVVPTLRVGAGVASQVMNYYNKICNQFNIDFMTFTEFDNQYTKNILDNGGNVFCFENSILKSHRPIKNFFREHAGEYAIVHCHVISKGAPCLYYAKKYGVKNRIMHAHCPKYSDNFVKSIIVTLAAKICFSMANIRVSCSKQTGERVYRRRSFKVVNNAIDLSKFSNKNGEKIRVELGVKRSDILFGIVGRLAKEKNQVFAIKVFSELKKNNKFKNSKLLIIGKGPKYDSLLKCVKRLKLDNDVYFIESVDNIENYYAAMDCFVFPSLYEGLGISAIEAQASGLPCFCASSLPDEVFATVLARKFDLHSGEKIWSDRIASSNLDKKNVKEQLQKAGFDINMESKKLISFYRSLIESNCKGEGHA